MFTLKEFSKKFIFIFKICFVIKIYKTIIADNFVMVQDIAKIISNRYFYDVLQVSYNLC